MSDYRPIDADDVLAELPPERHARTKARGADLIAEELALRDLRRAEKVTHTEVPWRPGGRHDDRAVAKR